MFEDRKKQLIGRTVVDYKESNAGVVLILDSGEEICIAVDLEGGLGADNGWYLWGVLRFNGQQIARV